MILADTSGLLAYYNRAEPGHDAVRGVVERTPGPLVVSPYVVAELDHLVMTRMGVDAELAVLDELSGGAYELASISAAELARARDVVARFRDQGIGVTDASLVVLARRYRTRAVLTLDHRHFDVLLTEDDHPFDVLP